MRGRLGAVITEAAIVAERNTIFRDRVSKLEWDKLDSDPPGEAMPTVIWDDSANKLGQKALREILGLVPTTDPLPSPDSELHDRLMRELENREKVWRLMEGAATAVRGGATTPFLTSPLGAARSAGCKKIDGKDIDLQDLMRMMHMFGDKTLSRAPRPIEPIADDSYFYTSEQEVAVEVGRRARELACGINWEGAVSGGHELRKSVWNRYGLYCGCG